MRLVSMNVHYDGWTEARQAGLVELLARTRADILCLQEVPSPEVGHHLADQMGMQAHVAAAPHGLHTAILRHPAITVTATDAKYVHTTWHGFTAHTLTCDHWPPARDIRGRATTLELTVISAHLIPHSTRAATPEAQLLAARVRRAGWPGIVAGDLNHMPLGDPEPDWTQVPEHNRSARTVLDDDGPLRGDRTVGRVMARGGLTDVAAHRAEVTGESTPRTPTGMYGGMRVDQVHVTHPLVPAITTYERLDHHGMSDHHPVQVDLDLDQVPQVDQQEWH